MSKPIENFYKSLNQTGNMPGSNILNVPENDSFTILYTFEMKEDYVNVGESKVGESLWLIRV